MKQDIFELKFRADAENLRNRSFEPEPIVVRLDSVTDCDCGAPLLITDSGTMCRQCVLKARLENPMPRLVLNGKEIH